MAESQGTGELGGELIVSQYPEDLQERSASVVGTSANYTPEMQWLFGGPTSDSGRRVSVRQALTYSPVWSAVDILSSDVSKVPFLTYRWNSDFTKREKARSHPTWRRLRRNTGEMTSNQWLGMMMAQATLYGRAHSAIHQTGGGGYWLEFLPARNVEPDKLGGQRVYRVTRDGFHSNPDLPGTETRLEETMFNIQGLSLDMFGGLSLIGFARNTIGRMLSAEDYTDDFFSNDGVTSGVVTFPNKMSEPELETFMRVWEAVHTQKGKRHRIFPLSGGATFSRTAVSPEDALLIDNLNFGVKDVARFFKIPGFKLGDDSSRSFNSNEIEQQAYLSHTLMSWLDRFEREADDKLFTDPQKEAEEYESEFDIAQLLRAEFETRSKANSTSIQSGQKSPNEARADDKLPPYDGGEAFFIPANMRRVDGDNAENGDAALPQVPDAASPAAAVPEGEAERVVREEQIRVAHRTLLAVELEKAVTRIMRKCRQVVARDYDLHEHAAELQSLHGKVIAERLCQVLLVARVQYPTASFDGGEIAGGLVGCCKRRILEGRDRGASLEEISAEIENDVSTIVDKLFEQMEQSDDD